jgi:hypothetical protein
MKLKEKSVGIEIKINVWNNIKMNREQKLILVGTL